MPLPKLSESQVAGLIQQVAGYIEGQRHTYRGNASPLDQTQRAAMAPFFPESVLNSTRVVVLTDRRVNNPGFYGDLVTMGFELGSLPDFRDMAAITFVDTIVSHVPIENRLLFHELVHVVQYEKLGLAEFAAKYVNGFLTGGSYEAIPLEKNAYELDARFAKAPGDVFSVQEEVEDWTFLDLF
jgi:hypothetical protein